MKNALEILNLVTKSASNELRKSVARSLLLISVAAIFMLGLVMVYSATSAEILDQNLEMSPNQAFFKQLFYALFGVLFGFGVHRIGYRRVLQWSTPLLAFFTILLVLVFIPGIGREVNGARRWIGAAGLSFQPSEFVKYLIPIYFIRQVLLNHKREFDVRQFLRILGIVAIPMLLILVEPNNGTVGVIAITLIMLFIFTRVPVKYWTLPLLIFVVMVGISAYNLPYVYGRLKVYINPELDIRGKGHQPHQAKIAAGSGQLWGKGPGKSWQKLSYLPEAQNDYIAAIYAEEFGFLGIVALIFFYMLVAYAGFNFAHQAKDVAGFYLAGAITFLISFQAFMNLGVVSGILPSTGLNLPLFSQGGSSLVANLSGIGLLLSVKR